MKFQMMELKNAASKNSVGLLVKYSSK